MSDENFFCYSIESSIINHYLQLLAQRQVLLERQVLQLSAELEQYQQKINSPVLEKNFLENPSELTVVKDKTVKEKIAERGLMKLLIEYLPAIFPAFWDKVSPEELAQLVGDSEKPVIPSPYRYLDKKGVADARNKIQKLSNQEQRDIREVCQKLGRRYKLSPNNIWSNWIFNWGIID